MCRQGFDSSNLTILGTFGPSAVAGETANPVELPISVDIVVAPLLGFGVTIPGDMKEERKFFGDFSRALH